MTLRHLLPLLAAGMLLGGCSSNTRPIPPVAHVDVPRFMGDWYVIAHIPSRPEREAFDAVESYALRPDGRIQTTFRYRKGSFEAPIKTMHPIGSVKEGTNGAEWGMQFVWPIKAEYVIVDIDSDYQLTIIGRSDRDYAWIMARTPQISETSYQTAVARLKELGYSVDSLRRVPQRWPEAPAAGAKP